MMQSKRITDRHDDAVSLRHKSTVALTIQIATVAASKMQASDWDIAQCNSARPGPWSSANAATHSTSRAPEPTIVAVANDAMGLCVHISCPGPASLCRRAATFGV